MFRNPVIAKGYTIPARKIEERGLELSVDLMLSLAQTSWATVYEGSVMLKGFGTLLLPTLRDGASVTWHLTVNTKGERHSYNEGLGITCLRNIDDALFPGTRHFVGWSASADYLVGKFSDTLSIDFGLLDHFTRACLMLNGSLVGQV
jgi:hypothetical protein